MSADRFEGRVADWLEDGPESAPEWLVAVVLDHADGHPRSRARTLARRIRGHHTLLLAVAIIAVAGSVALGAVVLPGPVRPTASVSVEGTETCEVPVPGTVTRLEDNGSDELSGRISVCRVTASDPRLTGLMTRHVSAWRFPPGSDAPDGATTQFGRFDLVTDGGTWEGAFVATYDRWDGVVSPGRMTWIGVGRAAYAGQLAIATAITDGSGSTRMQGAIEPITSDAAVGQVFCWVGTEQWLTQATTRVHHVARSCMIESDEPRLAGTADEVRDIATGPEGSARDDGTLSILTVAGAWSGSFSGTGDWWVPGEVRGVLTGSGGLAGRRLTFRVLSEDGMHGVLVGTVEPDR